jgi:serine phosphatase RsbU (regulator of sigma subunit)
MREEEYEEWRLLALLNTNLTATPQLLLSTILNNINHFVGNTPQHDDITLMLLRAV